MKLLNTILDGNSWPLEGELDVMNMQYWVDGVRMRSTDRKLEKLTID